MIKALRNFKTTYFAMFAENNIPCCFCFGLYHTAEQDGGLHEKEMINVRILLFLLRNAMS